MTREELGWNAAHAAAFQQHAHMGHGAGRVAQEHRNGYLILTEQGDLLADVAGAFRHRAHARRDLPTVGDWVVIAERTDEGRGTIHDVLPRSSLFSRKAAGSTTEEQPVAANVDTLFLVTGLDDNFNLRRIERYLLLAWESGARPVIVLNKADLCDRVEEQRAAVEAIAFGTPVVAVSALGTAGLGGDALAQLEPFLAPRTTIALLGSSGVGKSTITNALAGAEVQAVSAVSESVGKGRHTTTRRELVVLPCGALVIDTPGMRELGLWGGEETLGDAFEDVGALAADCRFRDCTHHDEPGCAVQEAIARGDLDEARFRSYLKLGRELAFLERRQDAGAQLAEKRRWKQLSMQYRKRPDKRR